MAEQFCGSSDYVVDVSSGVPRIPFSVFALNCFNVLVSMKRFCLWLMVTSQLRLLELQGTLLILGMRNSVYQKNKVNLEILRCI